MSNPYIKKPWLKSYPEGINDDLQTLPFENLAELYDASIKRFNQRKAFTSFDVSLTYEEAGRLSKNIAIWLQQRLKQASHVGIMAPNCHAYPLLIKAIHQAGFIVVNINPLLPPRELKFILKDSQIKALFIWDGALKTLNQCPTDNDLEWVIPVAITDFFPALKQWLIRQVLILKKRIPRTAIVQHYQQAAFSDIFATQTAALKTTPAKADDMAFLQYTGGTTGLPKGVILTHRNLITNTLQVTQYCDPKLARGELETSFTALPLYHIFSLTASFYAMFYNGVEGVIITNPRDIPTFIKTLKKHPPSVLCGVNTLFQALCNASGINEVDFSRFSMALGGGMAVQKATSDAWKKITGHFILEAYGLTETSPAAAINPYTVSDYTGSIGLPIPATMAYVLDEHNQPVALGETGEIAIAGPQVSVGYWHNEEANRKNFTSDGWFKTGDIGRMDEDGYLFLLDRKNDMLVVSGFNVYPTEVEQIINTLDEVIECGCIGVDDQKSGQVVKAFVQKKPNSSLTKQQIIDHCSEQLTGYKVPKHIEFVEELPKSNVGKVLRKELRELKKT